MSYLILDTENVTNIICVKGTLFDVEITYTDEDGDPIDFTGFTLIAEVKKSLDANEVLMTFKVDDGTLEVEGNIVRLSAIMELDINYYMWDLKMTDSNGTERIHKGSIQVNP